MRIIRNELDDCERAIRSGDTSRATRELDDATTKLKRHASQMEYEPIRSSHPPAGLKAELRRALRSS